ncbi:MAG: transcriptional regulator, partial [Sphingobacteriales bacterium 39-40-5]
GLIKGSIKGTSVCYCIDPDTWKVLESTLQDFLANYKGETICCQ